MGFCGFLGGFCRFRHEEEERSDDGRLAVCKLVTGRPIQLLCGELIILINTPQHLPFIRYSHTANPKTMQLQPEVQIETNWAALQSAVSASEPPQVDIGELNVLRSLFKGPDKPGRKKKPQEQPLVLNPYRVLTAMDVRRMHYYRHGQEEPTGHVERTYAEVAKKMHMPVSTVFNALKCYQRDGHRFLNRRKLNFQNTWER